MVSSAVFIITTAAVSYSLICSEPRPTFFELLYRRFEYVLKIITSQGIIINLLNSLIRSLYYLFFSMVIYGKGSTTPQEVHGFTLHVMVSLWLLSMVVLINAYIGTFAARMAVVKLEPTVNTLEDLAASKTLYMTVERASNMKLKAMVKIY